MAASCVLALNANLLVNFLERVRVHDEIVQARVNRQVWLSQCDVLAAVAIFEYQALE